MSEFIIAIPSYQRANEQGTLDYLHEISIPKNKIFIFVQTPQDHSDYQRYKEKCNIIFKPANGIAQARNNILRYFKGQHNILMLDDDIKYIGKLQNNSIVPIRDKDLFEKIIEKCFEKAQSVAAPIWGVYPVNNAFFMQSSISTRVTVNTAVGFTKGKILNFNETFSAKEDIELCARILHEGSSVLRFNFLSVNAKHRTNVGGCYDTWHSTAHKLTVKRLCKMYPDILSQNSKKPNEVRVIVKDKKIMLNPRGVK